MKTHLSHTGQVRLVIRADGEELRELKNALADDAEIEIIGDDPGILDPAARDVYRFDATIMRAFHDAAVVINVAGAATKLIDTVMKWVQRRRRRPQQERPSEPIVIGFNQTTIIVREESPAEVREQLKLLLLRTETREGQAHLRKP